jgi:hypothetical protein
MYKNKLEEYAVKATLAPPFERLAWIQKLREYIRSISVYQLSEEIKAVTSPAALRMIQAAGVPSIAFTALTEQMRKVLGR